MTDSLETGLTGAGEPVKTAITVSADGEHQTEIPLLENARLELLLVGPPAFRRGDADADGTVTITDGIFTLEWLFRGGVPPSCVDAADADDSGTINVTDGIRVFSVLFLGVGDLPAPGPADCGPDPTPDDVDCTRQPCSAS